MYLREVNLREHLQDSFGFNALFDKIIGFLEITVFTIVTPVPGHKCYVENEKTTLSQRLNSSRTPKHEISCRPPFLYRDHQLMERVLWLPLLPPSPRVLPCCPP